MKTVIIILSIAGFALSTICFGQLPEQNDDDPLFYSAHFNLESNRLEHRIDQFPARTTSGDHFDAAHISRTYFVLTGFDMGIEAWMTKPSESDEEIDEEIEIEAWMTTIWI